MRPSATIALASWLTLALTGLLDRQVLWPEGAWALHWLVTVLVCLCVVLQRPDRRAVATDMAVTATPVTPGLPPANTMLSPTLRVAAVLAAVLGCDALWPLSFADTATQPPLWLVLLQRPALGTLVTLLILEVWPALDQRLQHAGGPLQGLPVRMLALAVLALALSGVHG